MLVTYRSEFDGTHHKVLRVLGIAVWKTQVPQPTIHNVNGTVLTAQLNPDRADQPDEKWLDFHSKWGIRVDAPAPTPRQITGD